jgi:HEPN domain-containing protein
VRTSLNTEPLNALVAGYLCQQATEKIMKELLVLDDQPFRRTHDLNELADAVLRTRPELREALAPLRHLTAWGYIFRYPGFDGSAEPEPDTVTLRATLAALEILHSEFVRLLHPGDGTATS